MMHIVVDTVISEYIIDIKLKIVQNDMMTKTVLIVPLQIEIMASAVVQINGYQLKILILNTQYIIR